MPTSLPGNPHDASPEPQRASWLLPAQIACFALLIAIIYFAAPHLPTPKSAPQFRWASYGGGSVFYLAVGAFVLSLVIALRHATKWIIIGVIVLGLIALIAGNLLEIRIATDLAKMLFASAAGAGFSRAIERPAWLVPICLLVPIADIWSVYAQRGVTRHVVERAAADPRWIDYPTIAVPVPGFSYLQGGRLGITDVFFLALFIAVIVRWNFGPWRSTAILSLGFVITGLISLEILKDVAVPALPILCILFLLANPRAIYRDMRVAMRRTPRP